MPEGQAFEMTPQGQIAPGLRKLLDRMRELANEITKAAGYNCGFNAALEPAGADVSHLRLADNGEEYSCVCEGPEDEPRYDIWKREKLLSPNLDLESAARFMLHAYHQAKLRRIVARRTNGSDESPELRRYRAAVKRLKGEQ